ncbi:peptidoglycan-binding protein [Mesorhizobium loti]|nr:SEL1-like repeat protein [Mesorhizobium loti]PLP59113.1 peptidoglycan-binding protein [Mesorhizobium loti]
MNNKRSYLDNLNAGRQRRSYASLEELNRSMAALEQRLDSNREEPSRHEEPRYGRSQPYAERSSQDALRYAQRPYEDQRPRERDYEATRGYQRPYDDQRPRERDYEGARGYQRAYEEPRPYRQRTASERPYQSIARDIERMRGQEDGVAMVSKIAGELRGLREELRQQMSSGLQREFQALRKDIQRAAQEAPSSRDSAELGLEFERLSGAIRGLAEKSDDKSVNMLRLELEQVRSAMDLLAREESVQAVDRRWQNFDQRWSAFESRLDDNAGKRDGVDVTALAERLEQIGAAVNKLPESLSLRSLEEKVRTLAGAVDHFASQQGRRGGDVYGMIDERLDEISRAIVASTVAAQSSAFDPAPFERIEQRIAALARQIEEVADERPRGEVMDHLFHGLEQRFEALSGIIERRQEDTMQQGSMLFRDLERRLDDVTDRLERRAPEPDNSGIMDAIDARFNALAQRLESRGTDSAGQDAIRSLESRLDDISSRLDSNSLQSAGIDPDLLRSLEAQVSGLSAHLSRPGAPLPEFEDIGPRIEKIEESIASNRDTILETARQAAENAVRGLGLSTGDTATVAGLAGDLKTLEGLTRRSDERNTKTFEAIHDTLLKIVDRLGSLEVGGTQPVAPKITVQDAPALDMDEPLPLSDGPSMRGGTRTPAQAAADAARAALGSEAIAADSEISGQNKSMFGGIARAFKMRRENETAQPTALADGAHVPTVDLDEPLEPKLLNRPLEPGSGAPDLNAIMKRVRDERGQPTKQNANDASKADFIAAARRAAQAAAAEAEALKHQSGKAGGVKSFGLGNLLKARRKPILMAAAAIMLALAGLQLGKAFLSDPEQVSVNDSAPTAIEEKTDVATMAPFKQAPAMAEAPALPIPADAPPVRSVDDQAESLEAKSPELKSRDDVVAPQTADAPAAPEAVEPARADAAPAAPALIAAPVTMPTVDVPGMAKSAVSTEDKTGAVAPIEASANSPASGPSANGIEVPQSVGPVALRDAAASGDAKALFEIGSRYAEARGVREDMATAAKWYGEAAERGFAPAEYRIGNFYEKGIGVERDLAKSKEWYRRAAEKGNASAMHNLAVLFAMGTDGAPDNDAATRWFSQAADLGVKDSQFNLGILAAKGAGMQQNLEESYKWFALVAKSGDKDAAAKRDEIAKALRPEQLERAKQATDLWKPKPLDAAANSTDMPSAWQDAPTTIAGIDMKKAVQNIQRILVKNGYDSGGTDGVMGDRTKKAIMAFQTDNGLPATGSVDEKLVKALLAKK